MLALFFNRLSPKTSRWLGSLGIPLLGVFSGMFFQGSFMHQVLLIVGAFYALIPFFVVLTASALIALFKRKTIGNGLKQAAFIWCICASSFALSYGIGNGIRFLRENATRDYVALTISVLDDIKTKSGAYPKELPPALVEKASPWGYPAFYSSDGKTFRFAYDDTAGMMDGYELNSGERIWHHYSA